MFPHEIRPGLEAERDLNVVRRSGLLRLTSNIESLTSDIEASV